MARYCCTLRQKRGFPGKFSLGKAEKESSSAGARILSSLWNDLAPVVPQIPWKATTKREISELFFHPVRLHPLVRKELSRQPVRPHPLPEVRRGKSGRVHLPGHRPGRQLQQMRPELRFHPAGGSGGLRRRGCGGLPAGGPGQRLLLRPLPGPKTSSATTARGRAKPPPRAIPPSGRGIPWNSPVTATAMAAPIRTAFSWGPRPFPDGALRSNQNGGGSNTLPPPVSALISAGPTCRRGSFCSSAAPPWPPCGSPPSGDGPRPWEYPPPRPGPERR